MDTPMFRQAFGQAADAVGDRLRSFEIARQLEDEPDAAAEMAYLKPYLERIERFLENAASLSDDALEELGTIMFPKES